MNDRKMISTMYEIDAEAEITTSDASDEQGNALDAAGESLSVH
jgi:hypothetical protein